MPKTECINCECSKEQSNHFLICTLLPKWERINRNHYCHSGVKKIEILNVMNSELNQPFEIDEGGC